MRCRVAAVPLLLAGALLAPAARAQMPEVPLGKWWKRPKVVQELGITAEQQEKLDEIFAKHRREFVDLKADVEKKQLDVEDLMRRKDSDPKKVTAAIDTVEASRARLRKAVALMVLDMRGVLSAEQWKMVVEKREQWRQERREQFRERGREFGTRRPAGGGPPSPGTPPPSTK